MSRIMIINFMIAHTSNVQPLKTFLSIWCSPKIRIFWILFFSVFFDIIKKTDIFIDIWIYLNSLEHKPPGRTPYKKRRMYRD